MSIGGEIVAQFGKQANDEGIIKKCEEMMELFGLSAEDLFLKWESYAVSNSIGDENDVTLTAKHLERLQDHIQRQIAKENQRTPGSAYNHKRVVVRNTPNTSLTGLVPVTPLGSSNQKRRKLETPRSADTSLASIDSTGSPSTPMHRGTPSKNGAKSGQVLETLNETTEVEEISEGKPRLVANFDPAKYRYRTMNQKLLEVADYLDAQIDDTAKKVLAHYKFEQSEFGNPNLQSQTEILAVGRIVPDSPLNDFDADLNSSSLFLETSRSGGIGQRIRLDLSGIKDYSLFPGQIVCFRGINPTGDVFKATTQYDLPYLGAPVTSEADLNEYNTNLRVIVTAGPYTPAQELNYDLLSQWVDRMNTEVHPNTIIMFGPFIDITHRQIEEGLLNFPGLEQQPKTLDEVFKLVVAPILRKLECKQVILIPSTRDASSKHAAYPQEMFDRKALGLPKNFKCFPNPATFSLNEMLIGCSNVDILHDLKDINSGRYTSEPRFNRVAEHVLEQGRYYPTFPGSYKHRNGSGSPDKLYVSGSDLHIPYMGLSEFPDSLPDVLILPSDLKYFAKVVKNVLVINPGSFVKMNSHGSYAQVAVGAPQVEHLTKVGDAYLNDIWKRARVDIVRS